MAKTNGLDQKKTKGFVSRIENLEKKLDEIAAARMAESKAVREDIKAVYSEAKGAELPVRPLKAVVKARKLERQATQARERLNDIDEIDKFDLIRMALGDLADTPLGQASIHAVA